MKPVINRLLLSVFLVVMVVGGGWFTWKTFSIDDAPAAKTLRVVMLGSPNETLDYGRAQTYYPWAIVANVCDVLVGWRQGRLNYQLATAIEPNQDATLWTVWLRPGIRFSDGTPLTSRDALASLRFLAQSVGFGSIFDDIDFYASQTLDDHKFILQLKRARADLVPTVLSAASMVWKDGKGDAARPVCTGPWQVSEFTAHKGALLSRNAYAWQPARFFEHIDIRPLPDASARVNALLSGVADYAFDIPVSSARRLEGLDDFTVVRSGVAGSSAFYFALNTRVKPFDDLQVRQAIKALVNRQQLVDVVLEGYGYRGNDFFGKGLQDDYLPDVAIGLSAMEARRVLQQKGVTALSLLTADLTPGLNNAAELLRQQLADAGVMVTLEQVNATEYLSDVKRLHQSQMITLFALNRPFVATLPVLFGSDNPYNYGGWYPQTVADRVNQLRATTEPALQQPLLQALQSQIVQEGPYLVWGYRDQLSGAVAGLQGVELNQGVPLFGNASLGDTVPVSEQ